MAYWPTVVFFHPVGKAIKERLFSQWIRISSKKVFVPYCPDLYLHGERKEKDLTKEGVEFGTLLQSNFKLNCLNQKILINKGLKADSKRFGVTGLSYGRDHDLCCFDAVSVDQNRSRINGKSGTCYFTNGYCPSKWTEVWNCLLLKKCILNR